MCLVLLYLPFDCAYYVVGHNEHRTFVEARRPTELIAIQEKPALERYVGFSCVTYVRFYCVLYLPHCSFSDLAVDDRQPTANRPPNLKTYRTIFFAFFFTAPFLVSTPLYCPACVTRSFRLSLYRGCFIPAVTFQIWRSRPPNDRQSTAKIVDPDRYNTNGRTD